MIPGWVWPAAKAGFLVSLFILGYYEGWQREKVNLQADRVKQLTALAAGYEAIQVDQQQKVSAYERENISLGAERISVPDVAVRLCDAPPTTHLPAADRPAEGLPAPARVLPPVPVGNSPGPDVGPALFDLTDYADEIVAMCRAQ